MRRYGVAPVAAVLLGFCAPAVCTPATSAPDTDPMIVITDLAHPGGDPDDHIDLAVTAGLDLNVAGLVVESADGAAPSAQMAVHESGGWRLPMIDLTVTARRGLGLGGELNPQDGGQLGPGGIVGAHEQRRLGGPGTPGGRDAGETLRLDEARSELASSSTIARRAGIAESSVARRADDHRRPSAPRLPAGASS